MAARRHTGAIRALHIRGCARGIRATALRLIVAISPGFSGD
jgi:hypothetical protein